MNKKLKLAIFVSGSGSNAEAIITYFRQHPQIEVVLILTNNPEAYALQRAKKFNIPSIVFSKDQFRGGEVTQTLWQAEVTHIVLAGFLWLIPDVILSRYPHHIINIHPSLLPKFGGKGMYGIKVHQAVVAAHETETGITIHEVNSHYDEGKILAQVKCPVQPTDDAETVAANVLKLEHAHYPRVIERWATSSVDRPR
ncbi:MAG: phosphoribosylglycinamide formyltransferase [Bacteroidetes bacterium]|nr:phosphoribosylglycinamide formyltransferase [Bacteroidota bacterium]MBS1540637.1 phosphoribosylglycinamide formyltransferase [Bacteroidota bacterium]